MTFGDQPRPCAACRKQISPNMVVKGPTNHGGDVVFGTQYLSMFGYLLGPSVWAMKAAQIARDDLADLHAERDACMLPPLPFECADGVARGHGLWSPTLCDAEIRLERHNCGVVVVESCFFTRTCNLVIEAHVKKPRAPELLNLLRI